MERTATSLNGPGILAAPALLFALIHRSAWNRNSANFAFWGFSEVRARLLMVAPCIRGRRTGWGGFWVENSRTQPRENFAMGYLLRRGDRLRQSGRGAGCGADFRAREAR